MVLIARTGALDEGDVLGFLAVGRTQDLAAGGAVDVGQTFEFNAGDDVLEAAIAVGLNLRCVIGLPTGCPHHRAGLDLDRLFLHVEVDRTVLARGLGLFRIGGADDRRVQHVALRIGHRVRQVGGLVLAEVIVERIVHHRLDRTPAVAAGGAVFVHVARLDLDGNGVIAGAALDVGDFGQRQHAHARVALEATQVDFQAANGVTQLGEVAIQLGRPSAQCRIFLNQDDVLAGFGRFERGGHAGNPTAHHENRLVGRNMLRHR